MLPQDVSSLRASAWWQGRSYATLLCKPRYLFMSAQLFFSPVCVAGALAVGKETRVQARDSLLGAAESKLGRPTAPDTRC